MWDPTSGTELIDGLIDGVHIGDNLVFQGDEGAPLGIVVDRFVAAATGHVPLVVVSASEQGVVASRLGAPATGERAPGLTVLDWSPARTGRPSHADASVRPGAAFEEALASLHEVEERVGAGAAFVFDRLSEVQATWGGDAALELFLSTCPRLYRRRSLAVWPVEAARHRPTFLRRLAEITQVVVEFSPVDDQLELTVRKADGRRPDVTGRSMRAHVADGDLRAVGAPTSTRERLGTAIRDRRLALGLPQVDVARRVGITPSALSQVERGVRGPSGDTLMRLWEVLGVPFGPSGEADRGYEVARRSGRERARLHDGLVVEQVLEDESVGEVWFVEVAPGAAGDRPPFTVKSPETVTVVRGVLDIHIAGRVETLHEGDALLADDAAITGWANPGSDRTEVVWALHHRR